MNDSDATNTPEEESPLGAGKNKVGHSARWVYFGPDGDYALVVGQHDPKNLKLLVLRDTGNQLVETSTQRERQDWDAEGGGITWRLKK